MEMKVRQGVSERRGDAYAQAFCSSCRVCCAYSTVRRSWERGKLECGSQLLEAMQVAQLKATHGWPTVCDGARPTPSGKAP